MHYAESPAPSAAGDSKQIAESQRVMVHCFAGDNHLYLVGGKCICKVEIEIKFEI